MLQPKSDRVKWPSLSEAIALCSGYVIVGLGLLGADRVDVVSFRPSALLAEFV
jgi:hypothetical protein